MIVFLSILILLAVIGAIIAAGGAASSKRALEKLQLLRTRVESGEHLDVDSEIAHILSERSRFYVWIEDKIMGYKEKA